MINSLSFTPTSPLRHPIHQRPKYQQTASRFSSAPTLPQVNHGLLLQALKSRVAFGHVQRQEQSERAKQQVNRFEQLVGHQIKGFKLDDWQRQAMTHLADGKSVLVDIPTSGGKTMVAKFGIESLINPEFWPDPHHKPERHKVFYTTPRKALSNEKLRELTGLYGAQNIGLMTGDITINPEAPIVIMTTEVLRQMLYSDPERLNKVGQVVFDEFHFINDLTRGPVWEECVIGLRKLPIQKLYLSASMGNATELVKWINKIESTDGAVAATEHVSSSKRPVKLNHLVYNHHKKTVFPAFSESGKSTQQFWDAFSPKNTELDDYTLHLQPPMRKYFEFDDGDENKKNAINLFPAVMTGFRTKFCIDNFKQAAKHTHKSSKPQQDDESRLESLLPGGKEGERKLEQINKLIRQYQRKYRDEIENKILLNELRRGYYITSEGLTQGEWDLVGKCLEQKLVQEVKQPPYKYEKEAHIDLPMDPELQVLIDAHKRIDPYLEVCNPLLIEGLKKGYGIHHGGMTYAERSLVEQCMMKGKLKMVWGTDTIGAGINVPIKTAVISQFEKFNGIAEVDLGPTDFQQIVGRAGRRGLLEPGYVLLVPPLDGDNDMGHYVKSLVNSKPDYISSKFKPSPSMLLGLLKHNSLEEIKSIMNESLRAFQTKDTQALTEEFDKTMEFLKANELIHVTTEEGTGKEIATLTPLGQDLSILPDTALIPMMLMLKGLIKQERLTQKEEAKQIQQLMRDNETFAFLMLDPEANKVDLAEYLAPIREKAKAVAQSKLSDNEKSLATIQDLSPVDLAVLLSAGIEEHYKSGGFNDNNFSDEFNTLLNRHAVEWLTAMDKAAKEGLTRKTQAKLNFFYANDIQHWMTTQDWVLTRQTLEEDSKRIGYFMNSVRRTVDLLKHVERMQSLPPEFKEKLSQAQELLLQSPIKESLYC